MDKRTVTAVLLSLIVLIGWSIIQKQLNPPKDLPPDGVPGQQIVPTPQVPDRQQQQQKPLVAPVESEPTVITGDIGSSVVVETDLYKAVFSTQGGIISYWELKEYTDQDNNMPVVLLKEPGVIPPLSIILEGPDRHMPQKLIYTTNTKKIILSDRGDTEGELIFTYNNNGIRIKKKFIFYNDDYRVDLSIETAGTPSYLLPVGTDFGIFDKDQREHKGPVALIGGTDREEFDDGDGPKFLTGNITWIAQEDKYFAAAIIPKSPVEGATLWQEGAAYGIALKLAPQKHDFVVYAGPKEYDRLEAISKYLISEGSPVDVHFEYIIDFGWFSIVAMPLFWVLKYFNEFFGNYGWSIILLTIVTRIPFIPILHKSQQSMKKMQKIQPLMKELKEKYKNDAAKLQKETMAIYKKHKVNPIGGCLPMFLQIPVFIALYNVLLGAIELRGAPFVLWITDLSVKDPYYVLPIVMGLTMVLQQKMTPTAMDPKQAKMMMFMPIIFTFMFLTFASGLVLYWLVNNTLGIIQQYFVNKKAT